MIRNYWYYMLGRLVCGDDCLVQYYYNGKPSNYFRYQIQSSNFSEGVEWGYICKDLFQSSVYHKYRKKNGNYCFNVVINDKIVKMLIRQNFLQLPKPNIVSLRNTSFSLLKSLPIERILSFSDLEFAEFLAGLFDSDGSIYPLKGEIQIHLDSQTANRQRPLAFDQIDMFQRLSKDNRVPRLNRVTVVAPNKNKRSKLFYKELEKSYPDIPISLLINNNRKGTSVYLNFSTCVRWNRLKENRIPIKFLIEEVSPRLIRKDKRRKFDQYYETRKRFIENW